MRVLVVGGGGREHALVWKIKQSPRVETIFCAPGNAGTGELAENVNISPDRLDLLLRFVMEKGVDLTVVGPEQPLVLGIVDRFRDAGHRIFGPTARAAELEGSKAFSKDLMRQYGIPTAEYQVFESVKEAVLYFTTHKGPIVVKASGLAGGKGVILCRNSAEGLHAVENIMEQKNFGEAGDRIVVEEFLEGQEVSLLAFTDGKTVLPLDAAQDHKAAYDGDHGPNTGGMGAYSPAPVFTNQLKRQVLDEVMIPVVRGMEQEGRLFQGMLYAGLMLTREGPKVLEFNARFGDPETQPLLMRMRNDIVPLLEACIDGNLESQSLVWKTESAVCVVMAAQGYPGPYEKGEEIRGLDDAGRQKDVVVFHAGTQCDGKRVLTNGGRVLGVTALGADISGAINNAYAAVEKIKWNGIHYRKDIGHKAEKP